MPVFCRYYCLAGRLQGR